MAFGAGTALAQSEENYWLTERGGLWNEASNWYLGSVPGPNDAAYLILPGKFDIFATDIDVESLYAEAGVVDLAVPGSGAIQISDLLEVSGDIGETVAGRLVLRGPGNFSRINTLLVGGSRRGPQFGTGAGHEAITDLLFGEPLSTLRFEVSQASPFLCPASITVTTFCDAGSGFVVSGASTFLRPGDSFDLIDARGTVASQNVFLPEFGLVDSPRAIDVEMIIEQRSDDRLEALRMKSAKASTLSELEFIEGVDLPEPPIDLLLLDVDRDGDRDLVVAMATGKHPLYLLDAGEFEFEGFIESPPAVRAATVGDFDDDGWEDLAFASADDAQGEVSTFLQILRNAVLFQGGPSIQIEDAPVSLAPIRVITGEQFQSDSSGIAVTGKSESSGRSKTRGYATGENDIIKTGEIEIGDDPGPSDPIEDENKKDPDPPLGVGGNTDALVPMPVLMVLKPTADGFDLDRTIETSGQVLDFDSGDIDGDGRIETLVLTDAGRLDLLRPLDASTVFGTVPVGPGMPVAVKIGDVAGDSRREVVVLMQEEDASSRIDVYRVDTIELENPSSGSARRPYLERRSRVSYDDARLISLALYDTGEGLIPTAGISADPIPEPFLLSQRYTTFDARSCTSADLDGNGTVDAADLGILLRSWGPCRGCPEDLDGNGRVDAGDVSVMLGDWGPC